MDMERIATLLENKMNANAQTVDTIRFGRSAWDCGIEHCDGQAHQGYTCTCHQLPHIHSCEGNHARYKQIEPVGDWRIWMIMAGRGFGKTRTGAEAMAWFMLNHPGTESFLLAATHRDLKYTCIEGQSGLLKVFERYGYFQGKGLIYNKSDSFIKLDNGAIVRGFSAEEPARMRGPQYQFGWIDEFAQCVKNSKEPYSQAEWGLRIAQGLKPGERPRMIATTTPLRSETLEMLVKSPEDFRLTITYGSSDENHALDQETLEGWKRQYAGTRIGQQEFNGVLLLDNPDSLWKTEQLDENRVTEYPVLTRVVVAVDPAVTSGENADETGIIVAGTADGQDAYVLQDCSLRATPAVWSQAIVDAYYRWDANTVLIETNNGGEALVQLIKNIDGTIPVQMIHAKSGKRVRAEPVSSMSEQGRVHHVGFFSELEKQLTTWEPESVKSPDRMDAYVYAIINLLRPNNIQAFMSMLPTPSR